MMIVSEELTPERIKEILEFPIVYNEDCPKLTGEQLARLRPKHPENFKRIKAEPPALAEIVTLSP